MIASQIAFLLTRSTWTDSPDYHSGVVAPVIVVIFVAIVSNILNKPWSVDMAMWLASKHKHAEQVLNQIQHDGSFVVV